MAAIDKRMTFYSNDRVKTLHIETDGCVVNITVGLRDRKNRRITRVNVLPDDESRGGDECGRIWRQEPGDSRVICVNDPSEQES